MNASRAEGADWPVHRLAATSDPEPWAWLEREWLLTNGTGAFAMGTALGCPTRRYHGLLVAATHPPVGRVVTVNQMWEQLRFYPHETEPGASEYARPAQVLELSNLLFRGDSPHRHVFAPEGHAHLRRFMRGAAVKWHYHAPHVHLSRELFLHWQQQAATLRYRVQRTDRPAATHEPGNPSPGPARLRLHPMLTLRDFHSLTHRYADGPFRYESRSQGELVVRHGDLAVTLTTKGRSIKPVADPQALLAHEPEQGGGRSLAMRFAPNEHWWYGVHYPADAERGQEDAEDYFVPGAIELDLAEHAACEVLVTIALGEAAAQPLPTRSPRLEHLARRPSIAVPAIEPNRKAAKGRDNAGDAIDSGALGKALALAADDFVVGRQVGERRFTTIMAGYPWFADWGRDTFIALPGLLLATGRHEEARSVLAAFAAHLRRGLVPNRFDDYQAGAAHYNTVDASLWFVHAAVQYLDATGDREAWDGWLAEACMDICAWYEAGTHPDYAPDAGHPPLIAMDADGLIAAGSHATQLTWMDAACGETIFTPRPGKCVEINALWYNALVALAERFNSDDGSHQAEAARHYTALAKKVRKSFNAAFWRDELGYLLDRVYESAPGDVEVDASVRPNQVFAVSLPNSPLAQAKQRKVLAAVRDRLLTPVGLRTLPADHDEYHPRYTGDQYQRDSAYHRGTIWPWLLGPYTEGVLRAGRFSQRARREAIAAWRPLIEHLMGVEAEANLPPAGALGQLAEIYEAEADAVTGRHRPVGCPAQGWSVAEMVRVLGLVGEER